MLKTDFKDDIFPGARRYDLVKNEDGTISLTDKTDYTQEGDKFGASEINEICREMNETKKSVGDGKKLVADAITAKGQDTAADAEFATMAENIGRIETGANQTNHTTHWSGYENICVETHPIDATQALVTIPNMEAGKSYYDNTSKITGNIANLNAGNIKAGVKVGRSGTHGADSTNTITGSFTSDATAVAAQLLRGYTAYVKGNKVTGTMVPQGARTITPGTASQTAIAAGIYADGATIVLGDGNLVPANIKKGISIFGKVGTWSGWVPEPTDLYLRGNNIANFRNNGGMSYVFEVGQIVFRSTNIQAFISSNLVDLSGFSRINVEMYTALLEEDPICTLSVVTSIGNTATSFATATTKVRGYQGNQIASLDVAAIDANRYVTISTSLMHGNISRIWLS